MNMIERFFNTAAINGARNCAGGGYQSDASPITLLSGPPSSGKTSLLFQYALNCAAERQGEGEAYVVFICNRCRFQAKPPFLPQGVDPSSQPFNQIQIKYVDDDESIKKYFSGFHLLNPSPRAVIVDDFGDFFHERKCQQRYSNPRGRDLAMIRVLALCQSAIIHANKTAPCQLLLSDTHHTNSPRLLFIYKRWVSSIFIIEGHGLGSFLLKETDYLKSNARAKFSVKYSVALQYLILEGITEG